MGTANGDPIYSRVGYTDGALVVTAATNVHDISGTIGTDIYKVATADATNGSWMEKLVAKYTGNSTTTSNAAVLKLWRSSVGTGTPTLGTQATLLDEIPLPATGALSTTATAYRIEMPLKFALDPGFFLLVKITVSQPASFGWAVSIIGGKY
jgi:hypothetical protein